MLIRCLMVELIVLVGIIKFEIPYFGSLTPAVPV